MQLSIPKRSSRDFKITKVSCPLFVRQDDSDVLIPAVLSDCPENRTRAQNTPLKWILAGQASKIIIGVDVRS